MVKLLKKWLEKVALKSWTILISNFGIAKIKFLLGSTHYPVLANKVDGLRTRIGFLVGTYD